MHYEAIKTEIFAPHRSGPRSFYCLLQSKDYNYVCAVKNLCSAMVLQYCGLVEDWLSVF